MSAIAKWHSRPFGVLCSAAFAALVALPSAAAVKTYVGTDGAWASASNWNPSGVPEAGDTAAFSSDATISGDFALPGFTDIQIAKGKTVTISGNISGSGSLVNSGTGTLKLSGENSFTGDFIHSNGTCYAMSPKALGSDDSGEVFVYITSTDYSFSFLGVDTKRDIGLRLALNWTGNQVTSPRVYFGDSKSTVCTNYFRGDFYRNRLAYLRLRAYKNSVSYFLGAPDWDAAHHFLTRDAGSEIIIDEKPVRIAFSSGHSQGDGLLIFKCEGNELYAGSSGFANVHGGYRTDVDYAFTENSHVCASGSMFDLNGTVQKFSYLFGGNGYNSKSILHSTAPALLTVTGNKFHTNTCSVTGAASITYEGASEKSVLMLGRSTSTGTLTVDGARTVELGDGAYWSGPVVLKNGAVLELDDTSAFNGELDLSISDDAVIKADFQGDIAVTSLTVDGVKLPSGLYAAEASYGVTPLSVIQGAARIYVKPKAGESTSAIWDGGGTDSKLSTAANWDNDTTPELTNGGLVATFPSAGVHPIVDADYFINSLVFPEGLGGSSTIEPSGNSVLVFSEGGGITLGEGASGSNQNTLHLNAPVFMSGTNVWNVGVNAQLHVTNSISGVASVLKTGKGLFYLDAPVYNAGHIIIGGGDTYIRNPEAFTAENSHLYVLAALKNSETGKNDIESTSRTYLTTNCTFNGETFVKNNPDVRRPVLTANANMTIVHNALITITGGYLRYEAGRDSKVYIRGGISTEDVRDRHCIFSGTGEFIIENRRIGEDGMGPTVYWDSTTSTVTLNVASNLFGQAKVSNMRVHNNVKTTVDYALHPDTQMRFPRPTGRLDLTDTVQKFRMLYVYSEANGETWYNTNLQGTVTGEEGSSMTETAGGSYTNATYTGGASYTYEGEGSRSFVWPCSSTGACTLAGEGTLEFVAPFGTFSGGAWTGRCSRVVLDDSATGVMRLGHASALGRYTDVEVCSTDGSAGTIDIPNDVLITAQFLYVNGVKQPLGIYGSAASGAQRQLGCFTGAGRIHFIGDGKGTALILR